MRTFIPQALIGAIVAVAAAQVPAQAAAQQQSRGEIVYITGGVGADERAQLTNVEKDFNLKLTFTDSGGHLLSDVRVVVKDAAGRPVLEELSGPIFLAKLPGGTYTVESYFNNSRQVRKITVGKKMTTASFQFRDVTDSEVVMR
jgi:hypothetical protein